MGEVEQASSRIKKREKMKLKTVDLNMHKNIHVQFVRFYAFNLKHRVNFIVFLYTLD